MFKTLSRVEQRCADISLSKSAADGIGAVTNIAFYLLKKRPMTRHTIFSWLKTGTLQNNGPYQTNVVHILLWVCSYFR